MIAWFRSWPEACKQVANRDYKEVTRKVLQRERERERRPFLLGWLMKKAGTNRSVNIWYLAWAHCWLFPFLVEMM